MDKRIVFGIAALFSMGAFAENDQNPPPESPGEIECSQQEQPPKKCNCERCQQRERKEKEKVAAIFTILAGMVASFIDTRQDGPHKPCKIGSNLCNIFHGLGNIITAAIKGGVQIEEYVASEDFREKIHALVMNQE